ncbi:MAG: radical SAM protein [Hydrogenophilales bacterium 16-64-46]|nr:MAG: radical SAM protein [Hydrogenophilales bacterium 12-64-13]OYZ06303.1 MAG: radical SAM protein [Hydrogenophilales bacterium 16-64-46]OZA38798.1 MAG: radical SAM protein [Hydrogenophilales bacterium 17-64-34]HQS99570.1 radical SAM protein [Thiobacillus sp.]
MPRTAPLTPTNHDRDSADMTYVYPVVSRRAGGVSVGINLNPNNACNWACVYCQVPNLQRGTAPAIDLALLERELRAMLTDILQGDFMQTRVPEGARRLNDIALSGNGEPTSAHEFPEVIELVGRMMTAFGLLDPAAHTPIKLVLITNGSLADRPRVQAGLARMAALNGEVWFKLDSATPAGMRAINQTRISPQKQFERLAIAARLCPTWLQTCVFAIDGMPPSAEETAAYLDTVTRIRREAIPVQGVLLYGLARPSMQPQASRLSVLPASWLEHFADAIRAAGLPVKVSP